MAHALLFQRDRTFVDKGARQVKVIGYVLADFPKLSETFVGNEIRAMTAHGHRTVPIVMHRATGPAQPEDVSLAATSTALADVNWIDAIGAFLRPSRTALRALSFVLCQRRLGRLSLLFNGLKAAAIARRRGCTHLHAHFAGGATAHAIVAARWIGATVSFIGHGHDIYAEPEDLATKLSTVDFVVGTCGDMTSDFRSLAPGAKVGQVYCGTDPGRFRAADTDEHNGRLLLIGRLVGQKGYDELLRALALSPAEVAVDIVGEGPLADELKELSTELGLAPERVRWLGAKPLSWIAEQGPHYLGLVAPFKIAEDGQRDSGPIVIKEAMAMGLPVIGTRFMGIKEMVSPETGFLVETCDTAGLAKAMASLHAMTPAQRRCMGSAARRRVEELFSLRAQAKALSTLVEAA